VIDYAKACPRGSRVLIKMRMRDEINGVRVPERSVEAKVFTVVAIGPKVEHLNVGDRVMMTGQQKVDWDYLPGSHEMLIIDEANVLCVLNDVPTYEA
jgi:NADPH:quinone reductase-like Zn-dependent oxidoreductase